MSLSSLMLTSGRTASDLASAGAAAIKRDGARCDQYHPPPAATRTTAAMAAGSQRFARADFGATAVPAGAMSQIGISVAMFLNDSRPAKAACTVILFFTVSYTVWERQMPPGGALVCTRAAMFTPSP